ncbi:MAG: c-type cytochrome [Chitinophagales bacterium]|nr:c-type cytochrome [Hyphomicrobiales bacterium]
MKSILSLALACMAASTPAVAQGAKDGQTVFNNACRTCHSVKDGDNRLGPSLRGVAGRKSGASAGYDYSNALKDGSLTWDDATLEKFIENPDAVAPGHNMKPYTGLSNADDRKQIITYLKEQK